MFEKVTNIFKDSKKQQVEKTKINIKKRSSEFDFDLLIKSLFINPYRPRGCEIDLSSFLQDNILRVDGIKGEAEICNIPDDTKLILADTTLCKNISLVATLRRYSPFMIIHKDIIISKYQILESVIYGADMIIIDDSILLSDSVDILHNFANNLGLRVLDSKNIYVEFIKT